MSSARTNVSESRSNADAGASTSLPLQTPVATESDEETSHHSDAGSSAETLNTSEGWNSEDESHESDSSSQSEGASGENQGGKTGLAAKLNEFCSAIARQIGITEDLVRQLIERAWQGNKEAHPPELVERVSFLEKTLEDIQNTLRRPSEMTSLVVYNSALFWYLRNMYLVDKLSDQLPPTQEEFLTYVTIFGQCAARYAHESLAYSESASLHQSAPSANGFLMLPPGREPAGGNNGEVGGKRANKDVNGDDGSGQDSGQGNGANQGDGNGAGQGDGGGANQGHGDDVGHGDDAGQGDGNGANQGHNDDASHVDNAGQGDGAVQGGDGAGEGKRNDQPQKTAEPLQTPSWWHNLNQMSDSQFASMFLGAYGIPRARKALQALSGVSASAREGVLRLMLDVAQSNAVPIGMTSGLSWGTRLAVGGAGAVIVCIILRKVHEEIPLTAYDACAAREWLANWWTTSPKTSISEADPTKFLLASSGSPALPAENLAAHASPERPITISKEALPNSNSKQVEMLLQLHGKLYAIVNGNPPQSVRLSDGKIDFKDVNELHVALQRLLGKED